ncbi:uncharacterized protein N7506_005407, partial [Penicillium brevicompactum]|uniref:uncharacterized protein n=1 Tax=Penicillium brevicompactum TaxID=5074 RepID=UPI002540286C
LLPEDWISSQEELVPSSPPFGDSQSAIGTKIDSLLESFDEVLPSESASQQPATGSLSSNPRQKNDWMWRHLLIRNIPNEWIEKRSQRKKVPDREICCAITNEDGTQCNWSTTDSKRHGSTTNIRHHWREKHGGLPPTDILLALKLGNTEEAASICNNLDKGEHQSFEFQAIEPLAKLRILALCIQRSPQRRQSWNDTCNRMNLSNKFIEHDVDTRWNSTFLHIRGCVKGKILRSIYMFNTNTLYSQGDSLRRSSTMRLASFPSHQMNGYGFPYPQCSLEINEFTLFFSEKRPQISLVLPIYYNLHNLLHDVAERKEDFPDLTENIASAVGGSIKKYINYYTFMDASDLYYTALVLDPRVKGSPLDELVEMNAGRNILQTLHILGPLNHWWVAGCNKDYNLKIALGFLILMGILMALGLKQVIWRIKLAM